MRLIVYFFVVIKCLIVNSLEIDNYKIELVQTLFRHGDRTPDPNEVFPTQGLNTSIYEPFGLGQLTNVGKRREYEIGQILKLRYGNFLGDTYKSENVFAYTTDTDRTKMSLQLVLASLFPPNKLLEWNKNLRWLPIPIVYNSSESDFLSTRRKCPRFKEQENIVLKSPEVLEKMSKYQDTYDYVMNKSGLKKNSFFSIAPAYNFIKSHISMKLPLPNWVTEDLYQELENMSDLIYELLSYNTEMKKIKAGPIIRQFIDNIKNQENKSSTKKIYLYSAHDLNVAAFLRAHDLTFPNVPSYGTTVIFEKLRGSDNKIYVRLMVWTGADRQLVPLKLRGCNEICLLSTYLEIVESILPNGNDACYSR